MASRRLWLAATAACVALALIADVAYAQGATGSPEPLAITARAIEGFEKANPSRRRFGRLDFRGGLVLTSEHKDFGGLSDLVVAPDGRRLLAVSDEGSWISAEIAYDGIRPAGLQNAHIGPLLAMSGRELERKRDHDAEAVTLLDGNLTRGTLLIAFERNHRIGKFPVVDGAVGAPVGYLKLPADARKMKPNKGFEALTTIAGGPLQGATLAISERLMDADGQHTGWLWVKGEPRRIAVKDIGEFDITSAASLADGAVLILERRFRWSEGVKMRLRYVKAQMLASSAVIEGETLFEADMAYEIDNMEGVAVHRGARGETVLTLVSDNNFNPLLQRTLMLQFTLLAEGLADAGKR